MKTRFNKKSLPEKFKPPQDPLEDEKKSRELEPRGDWKEKKVVEYLEHKAHELGIQPDEFVGKKKKVFQKLIWQLEVDNWPAEFDKKAKREYIIEFVNWLLGKSKYNLDLKTTPWGRSRLVGESIESYIEELVGKKTNYELAIQKLRCFIPQDIDTAWLYFKFIVTKIPKLDTKSEVANYGKIDPDDYDWDFYPELDWWLKINQGWKPVAPGTKPKEDQLPPRFDPTKNNLIKNSDYMNMVGNYQVISDKIIVPKGGHSVDSRTEPSEPEPNPYYFDSRPEGDKGPSTKQEKEQIAHAFTPKKNPDKEPEVPEDISAGEESEEEQHFYYTTSSSSSSSSSQPPPKRSEGPVIFKPPSWIHQPNLGLSAEAKEAYDAKLRAIQRFKEKGYKIREKPARVLKFPSEKERENLMQNVVVAPAMIHYDNPPPIAEIMEHAKKHKKRQEELKILRMHNQLMQNLKGMRSEMKKGSKSSRKQTEEIVNAITGHFTKLHESERRPHVLPGQSEKEAETIRELAEVKNKHFNEMRVQREVTEKLEKELMDLRETERVFKENTQLEKIPLTQHIKDVEHELLLSQTKLSAALQGAQEAKNLYVEAFEENKKLKKREFEHIAEIEEREDEINELNDELEKYKKEELSYMTRTLESERALEREKDLNQKAIQKFTDLLKTETEKIAQTQNEVLRVEREKHVLQNELSQKASLDQQKIRELENHIQTLNKEGLKLEERIVREQTKQSQTESLLALASQREKQLVGDFERLRIQAEENQLAVNKIRQEKEDLETRLVMSQFSLQEALQEKQMVTSFKKEASLVTERIKNVEQEAMHHRGVIASQEYRIHEQLKKEQELTDSLVNATSAMWQVLSTTFPAQPGTPYPEPVPFEQLEQFLKSNLPGADVVRYTWQKFQELKKELEAASQKELVTAQQIGHLMSQYNEMEQIIHNSRESMETESVAREIISSGVPAQETVEETTEERQNVELSAAKIKSLKGIRDALTTALKQGINKPVSNFHNKTAVDLIERYMRSSQPLVENLLHKSFVDNEIIREIENTAAHHLLNRIHSDPKLKARVNTSNFRVKTLAGEWQKIVLGRIAAMNRPL